MSYSVSILNNIRMNASEEYQARIPVATQENFSTIGQAFSQYELLANEYCTALINKIGLTRIEQKMFKNKLSRFKSGEILTQQDVEEIFIEMAKAEGAYDAEGKNPLGRRTPPPVYTVYHRMNRQDKYVISISDIDFVRVFRSPATHDQFLRGLINSVYSADEYDEWLAMKNVLATFPNAEGTGLGYFDYDISDMSAAESKEEWAKEFVKGLRKAVQDASFMSDKYNPAGVMTKSDPSELVLLINKDVLVEVDVERLATAFHQSDTDIKVVPVIVSMDDFGSMTDTYGLLVDQDFFRIYDTLRRMKPQENADGLFTNYFFHHWQILSASPFKTAMRLKKASA